MSDGLFSSLELGAPVDARPGYRLDRLQVYNWGTFHDEVVTLRLGGDNALLTGDIGSGKSTLVDALTTLLLPANRINYNKAAGAETRERSLRSYVLGHYRSELSESTGSSRPVGLRDHRHYSVVLAVFTNAGSDEEVTLAQVFWMRDTGQGTPNRFFVTAERALDISADFADFGAEIAGLKRRLRSSGAGVHDHFPEYGTRFRRLLGIGSEQALELLHQTISMKSVGSLTEFVRAHMLESADAATRISSLVGHFEDLSRAHAAVSTASVQLGQLEPLVVALHEHDELAADLVRADALTTALPIWIAEQLVTLSDALGAQLAAELAQTEAEHERQGAELTALRVDRDRLISARDTAGGQRLGELERLIDEESRRRDERRRRFRRHELLVSEAGLPPITDARSFAASVALVAEQRTTAEAEIDELGDRRTELAVEKRRVDDLGREVNLELRSLEGRQSNIDHRSLALRERLAQALDVDAASLPFAGELIQVRSEHAQWHGAAERVLRGFALSVLVPSEQYERAAAWVNDHHLDGRFVYYRVSPRVTMTPKPLADRMILADVLEVKPGGFAEWMDNQLLRRADLVCADTMAEFAQHSKAVTRQGQLKSAGGRHEKDDRFAVDDRTRWVLGWSNQDKIAALLERAGQIQREATTLRSTLDTAVEGEQQCRTRIQHLVGLAEYRTWTELDWWSAVATVNRLEAEARTLREGNAALAQLTAQLDRVEDEIDTAEHSRTELEGRLGALRQRVQDNENDRRAADSRVQAVEPDHITVMRTSYDTLAALAALPASLPECAAHERELGSVLARTKDQYTVRQKSIGERAVRMMQKFRQEWPTETVDVDVDLASAGEFRTLHERIAHDDLPRFEADFKRQLNTNAIHEIASFQASLDKAARQIRERIDVINESLHTIEYNPGRLIRLVAQPTVNAEVREFREALRACTDDALAHDDRYSEERFLRVQQIIERFVGREGLTEVDRRWTQYVSDVRNWYTFAASERSRETGEEWEHYTDSDGKSGGQKEKLAYTILAASLAYQFRLEWGVRASKDFRFAVIDEAFGRGSDVSTRYALDLFGKLGLQLLIVTPLQKVRIIEPHVSAVGFVENRTGDRSRLQTLTITEFQQQRAAREAALVAEAVGR
ncbi:ATP-binding protein [Nakamurella sp. A5-74]|uniref:ATP-binding protein n=1 Tax=Nakamurella sp. A5-74 TaxID=3158264 RepID=A0AAU8DR43_9ACTN